MNIHKLLKMADKFSVLIKESVSRVENDMFDLIRQMKAEGYRDEDITEMVEDLLVSMRIHSFRGLQIEHPRESTKTTDLTDLVKDERPTDITEFKEDIA